MDKIKIERFDEYFNNGNVKYKAGLTHHGLKDYRVLSDRDEDILESKIEMQIEKWELKYSLILEKEEKLRQLQDLKLRSEQLSLDASSRIESLQNILHHTLEIDDTISWEDLKSFEEYPISKPRRKQKQTVAKPNRDHADYNPKLVFIDKLLTFLKKRKLREAQEKYNVDILEWKKKDEEATHKNENNEKLFLGELENWEQNKKNFILKQNELNQKVEEHKTKYFECEKESIEEYCEMVLSNSSYPDDFPQTYEIQYTPDNKNMIVDYQLPNLDNIPKIKGVKFISSRKEIKESYLSESFRNKLFDEVIYQTCLRTIHELFEADSASALDIITFNGWVRVIDKATGKEENSCIVSCQSTKAEFEQINLELVDPKACFKSLKGVGSSKLYAIAPVKPLLRINKEDSRIAAHYDVADGVDEGTNLAMMDWEDFEHLIRELFEKEFISTGGEVKVTQASRDGGVDAIAFDPDPIRGGKIVIQAKRYTNTVGVSAVRDLYGTVMNEGATKGILVTTADFGPDAYNFAKDKPLTLMNGANLLYLLSKHGHKAKIDIKEAKDFLKK